METFGDQVEVCFMCCQSRLILNLHIRSIHVTWAFMPLIMPIPISPKTIYQMELVISSVPAIPLCAQHALLISQRVRSKHLF